MTRENKLALVVGFALILLVGILVSDHFSIAQSQEAANLIPPAETASDPALRNPDLMRFTPAPSPGPSGRLASTEPLVHAEAVPPRSLPNDPLRGLVDASAASPEPIRTPELLDLTSSRPAAASRAPSRPERTAQELPFTFHDVREGETLCGISERYYGDQSMALELARFNGLSNPDALRAGHRLKIPGDAGRPASRPAAPTPAVAAPERTYIVAPGDVLSEVAQREMGSARRWRALYEHNRDVIDDPDHVEVGVVLRIPGR